MAELFGREGELTEICAFLDGAEAPRALVIAGGPGIGKTALWSEGLEEARRRGLRTSATRPSEAEAALPFAALIDLLSDLADDALPALSPPQARALESVLLRAEPDRSAAMHLLVSVAVLRALEENARRAPVILGIDDLQWLDEPSARALAYALRRLGRSPVWLVTTRRQDGGTAPGGLEDALGPDLVHRIELGPMTLDALGPMLRERLGLALSRARLRAVLERSEGNPLHALELGRLVLSGASLTPGEAARVPATLGGLVAQRVRGLDGRTRRALLEVAALSRPSMELLDATGDELETAVTAGLVERSGDAVRFSHPLYASAIYTAATADERRRVHGDLAARITDPAERALHLALGADGPDDRLAAHLEEVAGEASERGAADTAAELARQARRLTSDDDGADGARRGLAAADYLVRGGRRAGGTGDAGRVDRRASRRSPARRGVLAARGRSRRRRFREPPPRSRRCPRRGRRGAGAVRADRARAGDPGGVRRRRRPLPAPRRGGGRVGAASRTNPSCSPMRSRSSASRGSGRGTGWRRS